MITANVYILQWVRAEKSYLSYFKNFNFEMYIRIFLKIEATTKRYDLNMIRLYIKTQLYNLFKNTIDNFSLTLTDWLKVSSASTASHTINNRRNNNYTGYKGWLNYIKINILIYIFGNWNIRVGNKWTR